jgi:hypothetical protein
VGNVNWIKPANAKAVMVILFGSGGGGASGRRVAAGSACGGGGGGAGAPINTVWFDANDLNATERVTVPLGGAGGAAVTTDSTNGNAGGFGNYTTFGGTNVQNCRCSSVGANNGQPGTTTGGAGGYSYANVNGGFAFGAGGAGGLTAPGVAPNPALWGTGGGGGGGISGGVATNGSDGNISQMAGTESGVNWGRAGVVDGILPTAGVAPTTKGVCGASAGGGAASITQAAQAGADAIGIGAGGGGGGASVNGFNSGAGGRGGPGAVLVVTYF